MGLVIVFRVEIFDFRGSHVQLRLSELDNRSQAQIVSPLRKLQCERGLPQELRGDVDALVGIVRAGPSYPYIPVDPGLLIAQPLIGFQGAARTSVR